MFKTKLIDKFYEALFCTDFNDYACPTQNAKTDYLFECKDFDEWFEELIDTFAEDAEVNADEVRADAIADAEFLKMLKAEYEELKELCAEDEDFDDEDE